MKKICTIFASILLTGSVFAQSPQKMSYQAVIHTSSNALVTSAPVGMQVSILQGSAAGSAVFVETHTPTTNANGLASLEIGAGTAVSGTMAGIDWSAGPYFIKTETDPTGGTSYTITGPSQLMIVHIWALWHIQRLLMPLPVLRECWRLMLYHIACYSIKNLYGLLSSLTYCCIF